MPSTSHTLFIDIETVSQCADYGHLDERQRSLWQRKAALINKRESVPETEEIFSSLYTGRAGIYAEFGKVIVISAGLMHYAEYGPVLRIKSFFGHDEKQILSDFSALLTEGSQASSVQRLCGHNIREFDVPYLCRRMTAQQIQLPALLNISGKKPWEVRHLVDTMEYWKFGDYKNYTSLDLLAHTLNIPSPKSDMDGSLVGAAYWQEDALEQIRMYCERDVLTVAQVYLRLHGLQPLDEDQKIILETHEELIPYLVG